VNYFIFDSDQSFPAAFANFRSNPNTGEIRGASVFFPLGFVGGVPPAPVVHAVGEESPAPAGAPRPVIGFRWGALERESLCDLPIPGLQEVLAVGAEAAPALTQKERIERYLTHIAAHEIGHTLGLRHNFKGSLRPLSSTVMDYLVAEDAIVMAGRPGSYDKAAIGYLYGLSPDLPTEPFCTDDDLSLDPDCRSFDKGENPFSEFVAPRYRSAIDAFLAGRVSSFVVQRVDPVIQYVRQGTLPDGRKAAFDALFAPIKTPLVVPPGAPANFPARVSAVARTVISRLFLPVERTLPFPGHPPLPAIPAPPLHPSLVPAAAAELGANLRDVDGLRAFVVRRLAADILQRMQRIEALAVLIEARDALVAQLPGLTGPVALETQDLLNRVQRHVDSYFD
jgi:hypothetical protein